MKIFLRIILTFIGVFILTELNSNSLISDMKGLFQKNPRASFLSYNNTVSDTGKITTVYVQLLHLKNDSCEYTDTSQVYLGHATNNSVIGTTYGFIYKKQYYLHACELSGFFNISLNNTVKQYCTSSKHCYGYVESDNESAVNYTRLISPSNNITSIYLNLLGKNNQLILKNDSVAYYYSMFKTLSVQYNSQDGPVEMYTETKGNNLFHTDLLPIEIMFLKKNHKLYLITMSLYQDDNNIKYKPGMLYNLIENK